ncbi:MAG: alpha/beta hydrolase [Pseudomonadaceae bacterium]|nr:alpha/beta hydrolase [Pseudomonadaceae bacterium]
MKILVGDKHLFFDIEGPEFVLEGKKLRRLPTLILLHGAPGNSDHSVFKPALSALRDACRIIYLDIAGAGRSDDPPDGVFSLERWADDLVEFCRLLDIEKPIVLGLSGGGFIAMEYGIRHPTHASGLVLASTQAKLDVERSIAEFKRLGGADAEAAARRFLTIGVDAESTRAFVDKCMSLYNTTPQPPRDTVIFRPTLAMAFHSLDGTWHTMDLRERLGAITAPTLVLTGDQDPVTPLQDSIDIVDRMTSADVTFEVIPDTGHGPWRDKPDIAFAILERFILSTQSAQPES